MCPHEEKRFMKDALLCCLNLREGSFFLTTKEACLEKNAVQPAILKTLTLHGDKSFRPQYLQNFL